MTRFIKSIFKGVFSLIKTALAIFLVLIALVSMLSLAFSGQLTAPREETAISASSHFENQIALLQQQLEAEKQGHPIDCHIDALILNGLFTLTCDVEPILVSSTQLDSIGDDGILASGHFDSALGNWGIIELRLVVD